MPSKQKLFSTGVFLPLFPESPEYQTRCWDLESKGISSQTQGTAYILVSLAAANPTSPFYTVTPHSNTTHLQAMSTVLWALNCSRLTTMTTSVKMSRLRRRLRLRRTSLAWRVNWMQLSAGEAMLSSPEQKLNSSYSSRTYSLLTKRNRWWFSKLRCRTQLRYLVGNS